MKISHFRREIASPHKLFESLGHAHHVHSRVREVGDRPEKAIARNYFHVGINLDFKEATVALATDL